jgi:hypothetical protein
MENLSPHENILTLSLIFRDHAKFILYEAGAKGDGAHIFFDCIEAGHTDFFLPLRHFEFTTFLPLRRFSTR